jgi:hypothetical protein
VSQIDGDLARLNALQVIAVGSIAISAPAQAASCYSLPCTLDDSDPVIVEYRRQGPRLAHLADLAVNDAAATELSSTAADDSTSDLETLRRLAIVTVTGLIKAAPATNPRCYSLPCPEDIAQAGANNQHRADVAHLLASQAAATPF